MKYILLFITSFVFAQQTQFVDFKSVSGQLKLNPKEKVVSGLVDYQFEVLKPIDTIRIDAKNMEFSEVKIDQKKVVFVNTGKELQIINNFQKGINNLTFEYSVKLKQALYFVKIEDYYHDLFKGKKVYDLSEEIENFLIKPSFMIKTKNKEM